jgi:hypothetical protein
MEGCVNERLDSKFSTLVAMVQSAGKIPGSAANSVHSTRLLKATVETTPANELLVRSPTVPIKAKVCCCLPVPLSAANLPAPFHSLRDPRPLKRRIPKDGSCLIEKIEMSPFPVNNTMQTLNGRV